jgi:hypothetical protein
MYFSTHFSIPFSHFLLYGIGKNIVEKGLLTDFYRFNQHDKPSSLLKFIRSIVYMRDHLNKKSETEQTSTVNIIVTLTKSKN